MSTGALPLIGHPDRLYAADGSLRPNALAPTDPAFDAEVSYEHRTGSRLVVAAIPSAKNPPVAMISIVNPSVLTAEERAELADHGTLETLRRAVRDHATLTEAASRSATLPPFPIAAPDGSSGSGPIDYRRTGGFGTYVIGAHLYEVYSLSPLSVDAGTDLSSMQSWKSIAGDDHQAAVDRAAREAEGAVVVIGPVDGAPVLERVPAGMTQAAAAKYVQLNMGELQLERTYSEPFRLTAAMASAAGEGAAWGESALVTLDQSSVPATLPKPAVFVVGASKDNPLRGLYYELLGTGLLTRAQIAETANLPTILGALLALFLLSLVGSPLAFVYERRRSEHLDLQRERERVQLEARARVLARLTSLSERVDVAAADAAGGTDSDISGVAADIDATVTELRRILDNAPLPKGDPDE
jgi:hypothetical protein